MTATQQARRSPGAVGTELLIAGAVTAYSAVLGAGAGLVWAAVTPRPSLKGELLGAERADTRVMGQDVVFAAATAAAGVLAVLLLLAAGRWAGRRLSTLGPGATLGLAAGGVAGSFVAAALGHARSHPQAFAAAFARLTPHLPAALRATYVPGFDFSLKAHGLLAVWPLVAVVLHGLLVLFRGGAGDRAEAR